MEKEKQKLIEAAPKKYTAHFKAFITKFNEEIPYKKYFTRACQRCNKRQEETEFYRGKNPLFQDNRISICRKCIEEIVDIHNPVEVQYLLSLMYLPYIEDVWEKMLESEKNPLSMYTSRMFFAGYQDYEPAIVHRMAQQLLKFDEDPYEARAELLTVKDMSNLQLKWGDGWSAKECLMMEDYYDKMKEDFNVVTAPHEDYLKKIVKTSLLMDRTMIKGNYADYQKVAKIFNDLMKAAEFAQSTKKDKREDESLNAVGLLYSIAERDGFIPLYHNEEDFDIVDRTEKNLKEWMNQLIAGEADLEVLLENAAKRVVEQEEEEKKHSSLAVVADLEDD